MTNSSCSSYCISPSDYRLITHRSPCDWPTLRSSALFSDLLLPLNGTHATCSSSFFRCNLYTFFFFSTPSLLLFISVLYKYSNVFVRTRARFCRGNPRPPHLTTILFFNFFHLKLKTFSGVPDSKVLSVSPQGPSFPAQVCQLNKKSFPDVFAEN